MILKLVPVIIGVGLAVYIGVTSTTDPHLEVEPFTEPQVKMIPPISKQSPHVSQETELRIKQRNPTMKIDAIVKTASDFYHERFRSVQIHLALLAKNTKTTPESVKITEAITGMFGSPERSIELYLKEVESTFSESELVQLNDLNAIPVVSKFNEIPDEFDANQYQEFTKTFSPSEERVALVQKYLDETKALEQSMNLNEATGRLTAQITGSSQPVITPEVMDQLKSSFKQVGMMAMHFKLKEFTDQEVDQLIRLKTTNVALKEEAIKQKVLVQQINQ